MKKPILLIWVFVILALHGMGAETVINGKVIGGSGLVVRLMTYADQVSYLRKTLATSLVGDDDQFQFVIDLEDTIYAWLDIEFRQGDIYIQPGQVYNVQVDFGERQLSGAYYDREPLVMNFVEDDEDRLNLYINDFNAIYNDFMLKFAGQHSGANLSGSYNSFKTAIGLRFQNANDPYFRNYVKYKSATMEMFLRLKGREKIGAEYLEDQPVLYNNIEYMEFFHLYFEKYFIVGTKYFSYNKTFDMIRDHVALSAFIDSLGTDPVLKHQELRELVLLSGLKELYSISGFDRSWILSLVTDLSGTAVTEELKNMASNLLSRFNRLKPGSPAPDFSLASVFDKKEYRLSDFKGKYTYIAFFDSQNTASQAELNLVNGWYEEYRNRVNFVAISVDKDPSIISGNPNISPSTWTILSFNNDFDLLEHYDAFTFPYFVLLDDQGRIVSCPARSPSEDIRQTLDAI